MLERLEGIGLLHLEMTRVDDSAVARLVSLEELICFTGSKNALTLAGLEQLKRVDIDDRDGLVVDGADRLELLYLTRTTRESLSDWAGYTRLRELRYEGVGQAVNLANTPSLPELRSLELNNVSAVTGGRALDLPTLERLMLIGDDNSPAGDVDLRAFAGCRHLRWITVRGARSVTGTAVVDRLPLLEKLAVVGADTVVDGEPPVLRRM